MIIHRKILILLLIASFLCSLSTAGFCETRKVKVRGAGDTEEQATMDAKLAALKKILERNEGTVVHSTTFSSLKGQLEARCDEFIKDETLLRIKEKGGKVYVKMRFVVEEGPLIDFVKERIGQHTDNFEMDSVNTVGIDISDTHLKELVSDEFSQGRGYKVQGLDVGPDYIVTGSMECKQSQETDSYGNPIAICSGALQIQKKRGGGSDYSDIITARDSMETARSTYDSAKESAKKLLVAALVKEISSETLRRWSNINSRAKNEGLIIRAENVTSCRMCRKIRILLRKYSRCEDWEKKCKGNTCLFRTHSLVNVNLDNLLETLEQEVKKKYGGNISFDANDD